MAGEGLRYGLAILGYVAYPLHEKELLDRVYMTDIIAAMEKRIKDVDLQIVAYATKELVRLDLLKETVVADDVVPNYSLGPRSSEIFSEPSSG